jgi:hypothetical protein
MAPGGAIILIALQMRGTVLEEFYYKISHLEQTFYGEVTFSGIVTES